MYDTKDDTVTASDGITYHFERANDGNDEVLTCEAFPGLEAKLGYEEYIEEWMSPRDACNVGTMSVSYNRYNLGDEDISKIDFEIDCPNCDGTGNDPSGTWAVGIHSSAEYLAVGSQDDCQEFLDNLPDVESGMYYIEPFACKHCEGEQTVEVNPAEYFIKERGARVVIGLFVYEHSGITMSAGPRVGEVLKPGDVRSTGRFIGDDAGWDTSFVGFIYDTPESIKECMGDATITDEEIEKALRAEVELYASYLEGDVTCYYVEDEETGFSEGCGGYVGEAKYTEQECFRTLESAIEARLVEEQERADMAARDIITKEQ